MNLRLWIARSLGTAAVSLGIALVAGLLSLVLRALGDRSGAEAVRGVTLVMAVVFVLAILVLVVLLAINELRRGAGPSDHDKPL